MSIKAATRTAIFGVSASLVLFLVGVFARQNIQGVREILGSTNEQEVWNLLSILGTTGHVLLMLSLLLFLVVLNSKQKSQAAS